MFWLDSVAREHPLISLLPPDTLTLFLWSLIVPGLLLHFRCSVFHLMLLNRRPTFYQAKVAYSRPAAASHRVHSPRARTYSSPGSTRVMDIQSHRKL